MSEGIIPAITSALWRLNNPKNTTTSPAVLKKIPERALEWIVSELKDRRARTGSVPSANTNIVNPPSRKFPVVRVYII